MIINKELGCFFGMGFVKRSACLDQPVMPDEMLGERDRRQKGDLSNENNQYGKMLRIILFHWLAQM